jgi:DNA repair photolyase
VFFTIPFTDVEVARAVEPYAPLPEARFHAMEALAAAGIRVGIGIAPVIPGLSTDIPVLLKRAKEAGAEYAFINMLRLPGNVAPYFEERLREKLPTKADRVLNESAKRVAENSIPASSANACAARVNTGKQPNVYSRFTANASASTRNAQATHHPPTAQPPTFRKTTITAKKAPICLVKSIIPAISIIPRPQQNQEAKRC